MVPLVGQDAQVRLHNADVPEVAGEHVQVGLHHGVVPGDETLSPSHALVEVILLLLVHVHAYDLDVVGRAVLQLFPEKVAPDGQVADSVVWPQDGVVVVDEVEEVVKDGRLGGKAFDVVENVDAEVSGT